MNFDVKHSASNFEHGPRGFSQPYFCKRLSRTTNSTKLYYSPIKTRINCRIKNLSYFDFFFTAAGFAATGFCLFPPEISTNKEIPTITIVYIIEYLTIFEASTAP